jgi:hypothetical protein
VDPGHDGHAGTPRRPWSGWALTSLLFTALVPTLLLVLARAGLLDASAPTVVIAVLAVPVAGVAAAGLGIAATRDGSHRGLLVSLGSAVAGLVVVALAGAGVAAPAVASARAGSVDVGVRADLARTATALETARATRGVFPKRGTLPVKPADPATHLHVCYYRAATRARSTCAGPTRRRRVLTYDSAAGRCSTRPPAAGRGQRRGVTCPGAGGRRAQRTASSTRRGQQHDRDRGEHQPPPASRAWSDRREVAVGDHEQHDRDDRGHPAVARPASRVPRRAGGWR